MGCQQGKSYKKENKTELNTSEKQQKIKYQYTHNLQQQLNQGSELEEDQSYLEQNSPVYVKKNQPFQKEEFQSNKTTATFQRPEDFGMNFSAKVQQQNKKQNQESVQEDYQYTNYKQFMNSRKTNIKLKKGLSISELRQQLKQNSIDFQNDISSVYNPKLYQQKQLNKKG